MGLSSSMHIEISLFHLTFNFQSAFLKSKSEHWATTSTCSRLHIHKQLVPTALSPWMGPVLSEITDKYICRQWAFPPCQGDTEHSSSDASFKPRNDSVMCALTLLPWDEEIKSYGVNWLVGGARACITHEFCLFLCATCTPWWPHRFSKIATPTKLRRLCVNQEGDRFHQNYSSRTS